MNFKALFRKILSKKLHPANKPHVPQPPSSNKPANYCNAIFDPDSNYEESEEEVQKIHGTSIEFGNQKTIQVDSSGHPRAVTQNKSYIIGSGKLVQNINEIGGVCNYCQLLAMHAYEKGEISLEQAQLRSLFDTQSARQCELCGAQACSLHCRPTETPDGILMICAGCNEQIMRKQKRKSIISFLMSPLLEESTEEDSEC